MFSRPGYFGVWLMAAAAVLGLVLSLFLYLTPDSGVAGSPGAILVIVSTALLLFAALLLIWAEGLPHWVRVILLLLTALDLIGTALAGWLLNSKLLGLLMVVGAIGWLMHVSARSDRVERLRPIVPLIALFVVLFAGAAGAQDANWSTFNGNLRAEKYSPLTEITPENVGKLRMVWRTHTGDVATGTETSDTGGPHMRNEGKPLPATVWSATPLFVNNTLYLGTPFYRIFALEPDSGKVKWVYDSKAVLEAVTQPDLKNRGVAYWQADSVEPGAPCQKRVYIGTMDAKLHSIDADTGKPCADFGVNGVLDINQYNTQDAKWPLSLLQPPTVFKDFLLLGWAGKDWNEAVNSPGTIFALDARTGALRWEFHAIPPDLVPKTGTANVWASMSVDEERQILYIPVSSPSPDFFGGARVDAIPLGTSITALDIPTGKVLWSRQLVHHDIWDFDTNSAPALVDIEKDGQTIPALVQTSKQGFIYVLNRVTGEPVYPMEERPVPASKAAGESAAPTQPYVDTPAPTVSEDWPGVFWLADAASFGYCSRTAKTLLHDGRFTPPSTQGTLVYPGTIGGVEWGGGAVDPKKKIFVVNSTSAVQIYRLIPRDEYDKETAKPGAAETGGYFPMLGSPYGIQLSTFLNPIGMPCWNPPYGTISAYDLTTGKLLWKEPFGEVQKWGFYMPESWGSVTLGGPVITASGVIFIGASMDSRVRALDLENGKVLWQSLVSAPAVSLPAVYDYKGKEYVTFAVGGNSILTPKVSDEVVTYALP